MKFLSAFLIGACVTLVVLARAGRRIVMTKRSPRPADDPLPYERVGRCCGCGVDDVNLTRVLPGVYRYRCDACLPNALEERP